MGAYRGGSRTTPALDLLADGQPHHIIEIGLAAGYPRDRVYRVDGTLQWLMTTGRIVRVTRGSYALTAFASPVLVSRQPQARCRHRVKARVARWILSVDGPDGVEFSAANMFVAEMVDCEQASVSTVERQLRQAGLITTRPGTITVLDRAGLVKASCACYRDNSFPTR